MKFKEVIIYNWYDNVISGFCKTDKNIIYYCHLVAMDDQQVEKIYICIELKYFVQADIILRIIKDNTYLENERVLHKALNIIRPSNENLLIKTDNLQTNNMKIVKYKSDFNWNHNFFSIDYPTGLEISAKLDDWWGYF
jgi:phosphoenolpyruvate carboxylase